MEFIKEEFDAVTCFEYVQLSPIKNQYNLLAKSGHCFSQGVLHDHTDYEGLIGFSILAIASNQLGQQPGQQPAF